MVIRKAGSEFQVNQTTIGDQMNPSIATDAKGNFVIVWDSPLVDSDGQGIAARQFRANGKPMGDEINNINSITPGDQFNPAIASDPNGNFVVSWTTDLGNFQDRSLDISARRFTADGTYLDVMEQFVNTSIIGEQDYSRIAINAKGDYVIVWESDRDENLAQQGIYAQRFSANGRPQGNEIRVSLPSSELHLVPAVAMNEDGSFIVAWTSLNDLNEGNYTAKAYAQRFNANGSRQGNPLQINPKNGEIILAPAIATTPNGEFIMAWMSGTDIARDNFSAYAQRYGANGQPISGEILITDGGVSAETRLSIDVDRNSNFVVAWTNRDTSNVLARRFDPTGKALGKQFLGNSFTESAQFAPEVAMQPQGDFVITWQSEGQDGNGLGIFAQRFELASTIAFDKRNIKAKEGQNAFLTLSRSDETHLRSRVTVDVIGGTATRGEDYRFNKPINVTFKPGQTEKSIRIPILKDSLIEKKETILLEISEKDRAHLDKKAKAKITIIDVPPKGRGRSMDVLLGDEQIAVGKNALKMEQVRSGGSRQPQLFASAENQPIFGQSFDINPFTGTGSVSLGNEVPEAPSLFAPTPTTETPFALAASAI